ncbi:MAG TPA: thiamine-phosphate kinase [Balneolaceae bacterium]|nr:thiamine-phosphate kinase [Balneolaceae bacterium]
MAAASTDHSDPISEIGEQALIRRFFTPQSPANSEIIYGIGDDCAVLELDSDRYQLISTDQLLEETHFLQSFSAPDEIGYKAAAVNLSDIAAMGGRPTGIFLSLGLPSSTSVSWVSSFMEGFNGLCKKYEVPLLGGDTTGSVHDIMIGITVLGDVPKSHLKLRADAKSGDVVCVTGTLGEAAAGLQLFQKVRSMADNKSAEFLVQRYKSPVPAVEEGQWLGNHSEVHAMIDLSDGLATDGNHICENSQVQMHVYVERLPLSPAFKEFTSGDEVLRTKLALAGGEDYHLLCTVESGTYENLSNDFEHKFGRPLYQIGHIKEGENRLRFFDHDKEIEPPEVVFNHF